jgi:putative FmdB family regulatory protein
MPVFEYTCNRCGVKFDEWIRTSDQKVVCPVCKSEKVEKLISPFSTGGGGVCKPSSGGG